MFLMFRRAAARRKREMRNGPAEPGAFMIWKRSRSRGTDSIRSNTCIYACGHPGMVEVIQQRFEPEGFTVKSELYWHTH